MAIRLLIDIKCDILKGRGPGFQTVCDRKGVKVVKSSMYIRYGQPLISKDYNYTNTIILIYNKF